MRLSEIDLAVIVVASGCCLAIGIILLLALRRTRRCSGARRGSGLFGDLDARDRQAFQISDEIVQGPASIAYALELGTTKLAVLRTQATLIAARALARDLGGTAPLRPEELVRDRPAVLPTARE